MNNSKIFAHVVNGLAIVVGLITALAGAHIPVVSAVLSGPIAIAVIGAINSIVHAVNPTETDAK